MSVSDATPTDLATTDLATSQVVAVAPRRARGSGSAPLAAWGWGLTGLLLLVAVWEGYKLLAPEDGVVVGGLRVLPRTNDLAMPHVWDMLARLAEPVTRGPDSPALWTVIAIAALATLGIAAAGWLLGLIVGVGLALVMQRWRLAEWGMLPWIVLSQTVPLIAFAPLVKSWGSQLSRGGVDWQDWMSVALIASYLAFFPIAVGTLKGLQSPDRIHVELLHTYGVGYWRTLRSLRLPAAVPYLLPALRLGAANAVIGAVVAEVSTGLQGGVGRLLVQFAGQASGDPSKAWAPIFGAVALGLVAAGSVALLGVLLRGYRRGEAV